ncbi:MAG: hypothetical protein QFX36_04005 [Archaeoglobales archaeon]|nr:hypothetical protein [Archaeoglobales archaeon]
MAKEEIEYKYTAILQWVDSKKQVKTKVIAKGDVLDKLIKEARRKRKALLKGTTGNILIYRGNKLHEVV